MKSTIVCAASSSAPPAPEPDRLSALLERFRVRASLFHAGELCGTSVFEARPGRAFLHVLRRGSMQVRHGKRAKSAASIRITEPTLLLYPRPVHHAFVNPPREGSDLTCATLDFDGGDRNPLVSALPDTVLVPLADVPGLRPTLELLFDETRQPRCGSRLVADRLFEVVLVQLLRWMADNPARAGISRGMVAGLADARLARALVAMHRDPRGQWTLAQMAATAGMSRSAFADAFRNTVGTTPAAYLSAWRLTIAASLVEIGRPIGLIADDLGFSGSAALSRAFRNQYGASPRDWLRQQGRAGVDSAA